MRDSTIRSIFAAAIAAVFTLGSQAALNPDPDIFDATKNGARSNGPNIRVNGTPLGGNVSVVNESGMPPLDVIVIADNPLGRGRKRGGQNRSSMSASSSSSSAGIPMGGAGGMSSSMESQQSPFPPPMGQKSQSSSQSEQEQSQQQMQGSSSSGEGETSKEKAPKSQQQSESSSSALSGKMPEAPPEQSVGDLSDQIAEEGSESSAEDAESGEGGQSDQKAPAAKKKSSSKGGESSSKNTQTDGQEMPGDMGGSNGKSRSVGSLDDVAVPSNL